MVDSSFDQLFEDFKHKHALQFPPPDRRAIKRLDWKFYLALTWAVATVLLVASQTATEFYQAKIMSGMNPNVALVASAFVLIAIEGGIVIGSAIKASDRQQYNNNRVNLAITLSVFISVVAGVNSSIGIIQDIDPRVLNGARWFLVFALGIGGSFVAWASGEVLGAQLAVVFIDAKKADDEHKADVSRWAEAMRAAWRSSPDYQIAMAEVRRQAKALKEQPTNPPPIPEQMSLDYRNLPDGEKRSLLGMSNKQIAHQYGLSDRSAYNWRKFAERDFGGNNGHNVN